MYSAQKKTHWYSGLYLQPQHLQSTDLHHEWIQAQQLIIGQPYHYGVLEWGINQDALIDFIIDIEKLRLVMPGGNYLVSPGNCRIEKRSFRDAWKQRDRSFTVWLALRRLDPNHNNVTALTCTNERVITRWVTTGDESMMKDIYGNGPDATVPHIDYNLRIIWDSELGDAVDCETLPLLCLRYDNEGVVLDNLFSPPALTIYSTPMLGQLVDAIYFQLIHRAHQLEEYKRPERLVNDNERGDQLIQLLVMRSLNRVLPIFHNFCKTRQVHPWQLYCLLCQLVGELSSFNDECSFLGEWRRDGGQLLDYDHHQLISCFESLRQTLMLLMNSLVMEDNIYISLKNDGGGIFFNEFDINQCHQSNSILLLLRSNAFIENKHLLANSRGLKLASRQHIEALIQHALPGVQTQICAQAPRGVPSRSDSYYFTVNCIGDLWGKIESDKSIAFYWSDAPEDLQVQIIFMVSSK